MSELNRTYKRLIDAGVAYAEAKMRLNAAEKEVMEATTAYKLFLWRGESAPAVTNGT